ncbi:TetR/AcrR family transcriptional regulator [Demequina sp. B12]|uniref:TetR/AcrR family transcriptional regulator n=1 Tax=Demequina sp. B12 TaxID=2992757 RepID=UPI00237B2FBB|nr:TetR/AcrR family transcriptional regulator [Demequina sp. B12]MDE0573503.1 TetR/AcrR family transcriptional regulator [Demequina sp. B12]
MGDRSTYHHGSLRTALLKDGHDLLAETGPERFSLNALARKVGVSPAAPYRHFPDRDHLLDAIADEGYEIFGAALADAVSNATDPGDAVRGIVRAYLNFAAAHATYFSVMFRDREDRPNLVGPPSFTTFANAIAAAQHSGHLDSHADTAGLARAIWAGVHGAAVLTSTGGFAKVGLGVPQEQLVEEIVSPYLRTP